MVEDGAMLTEDDSAMERRAVATGGPRQSWPRTRSPFAGLRRMVDVGDASLMPLLILFGLNLVDEFDRLAFAALTPEIRDAFDLRDQEIVAIGAISGFFVLLVSLPIGYYADRKPRVRMVQAAALVWGCMTILTGVAWAIPVLFFARFFSGVAKSSNEIIHSGLLADYYPTERHAQVFKVHRLANPIAQISSLLAGVIGLLLGWRWAFVLLAIPTFVLLSSAFKLKEPHRGQTIDPAAAAAALGEVNPKFWRTFRMVFSTRSLRRLWIGFFVIGVSLISLAQLLSLFFERVYDFGPLARGAQQFGYGVGTVIGMLIGGAIAAPFVARDDFESMVKRLVMTNTVFALGTAGIALSPWWPLSAFSSWIAAAGMGASLVLFAPISVRVVDPRIRSQAAAYGAVILAVGGLFAVPFAAIAGGHGVDGPDLPDLPGSLPNLPNLGVVPNVGYRLTFLILVVGVLIADFIMWFAHRVVNEDVASADAKFRAILERLGGESHLLRVKDLNVSYGPVRVLFDVNLELDEGEIVALLGTNGAGKSTLLNTIAGLIEPDDGAVILDGLNTGNVATHELAGLGIALLPGGRGVFPALTVVENLRLANWYRAKADDEKAIDRVYELFPILGAKRLDPAATLSGGQQQMLALGMAFIARPRLLLIDELSLGLAPVIVDQLLTVVEEFRASGTTVLLVEQSVNTALRVASRAYFMEKGSIQFSGPTSELLERPDLVRSVFLEGAQSRIEGASALAMAASHAPSQSHVGQDRDVILGLHGLTKSFSGVTAVADVDMSLYDGELLGIIGPNGAGKTTLFDLVSGFLYPDIGRIVFAGTEITDMPPDKRSRLGLARSFQDARLFPALTVRQTISLSLDRRLKSRSSIAAALSLPNVRRAERDLATKVEELIELVGLQPYAEATISELSTGTRRLVDLACQIGVQPRVILFDEPSSGVAQKETDELRGLLLKVREYTSASIILIEHDVPLLISVADRIVALDLGRVVTDGSAEHVLNHPQVVASYLGDRDTNRTQV